MHNHPTMQPDGPLYRRDFLKVGGLVGVASVLAACGGTATQEILTPSPVALWPPPGTTQSASLPKPTVEPTPPNQEVALRIAHITDMHVQPGSPALKGFTRALRHVHALQPKVDLVLNTGDSVMETLAANQDAARAQWQAFNNIVREECSLPIQHAIGNHDVWGWGLPAEEQKRLSSDPLFGKGMALQQLGMRDRYYSFDRSGWRFLILDSTHLPDLQIGKPYTAKLDEEQFGWLVQQLEGTPASMPICIASHIPILTACMLLDGDNEASGNWIVPGAWVHIDARRLWQLFWQYPNVKLCISGHTHQVEDLRYHGVKYLTDGAISANWWNGDYFDFPPGYVILNLYNDGSSDSEFITY